MLLRFSEKTYLQNNVTQEQLRVMVQRLLPFFHKKGVLAHLDFLAKHVLPNVANVFATTQPVLTDNGQELDGSEFSALPLLKNSLFEGRIDRGDYDLKQLLFFVAEELGPLRGALRFYLEYAPAIRDVISKKKKQLIKTEDVPHGDDLTFQGSIFVFEQFEVVSIEGVSHHRSDLDRRSEYVYGVFRKPHRLRNLAKSAAASVLHRNMLVYVVFRRTSATRSQIRDLTSNHALVVPCIVACDLEKAQLPNNWLDIDFACIGEDQLGIILEPTFPWQLNELFGICKMSLEERGEVDLVVPRENLWVSIEPFFRGVFDLSKNGILQNPDVSPILKTVRAISSPTSGEVQLHKPGWANQGQRTEVDFDCLLKQEEKEINPTKWKPTTPFPNRVLQRRTCLDPGQVEGLEAVLTREISLVQGPPGTGKSFLGGRLIALFLDQKNKKLFEHMKILLIAKTNHALDSSLEEAFKAIGNERRFVDLFRRLGTVKADGHSPFERSLRAIANVSGKGCPMQDARKAQWIEDKQYRMWTKEAKESPLCYLLSLSVEDLHSIYSSANSERRNLFKTISRWDPKKRRTFEVMISDYAVKNQSSGNDFCKHLGCIHLLNAQLKDLIPEATGLVEKVNATWSEIMQKNEFLQGVVSSPIVPSNAELQITGIVGADTMRLVKDLLLNKYKKRAPIMWQKPSLHSAKKFLEGALETLINNLEVVSTSRTDLQFHLAELNIHLQTLETIYNEAEAPLNELQTRFSSALYSLNKDGLKALLEIVSMVDRRAAHPSTMSAEPYFSEDEIKLVRGKYAFRHVIKTKSPPFSSADESLKVVAATCNGCALRSEFIKEFCPTIVIVEEAGQVPEPILSQLLFKTVGHLIMIGDHLQLSPEAKHYVLSAEGNRGFFFNISLLERLIRGYRRSKNEQEKVFGQYPFAQLKTQYRMHPDIATLVSPLYDSLETAEAVRKPKARPRVSPLSDLRVVFFDHSYGCEAQEDSTSSSNSGEATLAVAIAKLLRHHGHGEGSITVLTPYKGQWVKLIKAASEAGFKPRLGTLDRQEMEKTEVGAETLEDTSEKGAKKGELAISTVDNFQGLESDIIIVSLVRGNTPSSRLGFVRVTKRANVLLSRARRLLILLGDFNLAISSDCFFSKICDTVRQKAEDGSRQFALLDSISFKCEHGTMITLKEHEDFDKKSPLGGCDKPCPVSLRCGHPCSMRCHGNLKAVHESLISRCRIIVKTKNECSRPSHRGKWLSVKCCERSLNCLLPCGRSLPCQQHFCRATCHQCSFQDAEHDVCLICEREQKERERNQQKTASGTEDTTEENENSEKDQKIESRRDSNVTDEEAAEGGASEKERDSRRQRRSRFVAPGSGQAKESGVLESIPKNVRLNEVMKALEDGVTTLNINNNNDDEAQHPKRYIKKTKKQYERKQKNKS